jgi:hypothetical protein
MTKRRYALIWRFPIISVLVWCGTVVPALWAQTADHLGQLVRRGVIANAWSTDF